MPTPTEKSLQNLRPRWEKGCASPNPSGRPRRPLSSAYATLLESRMPAEVCRALKVPAGTLRCQGIALARAREALGKNGTLASKEMREGTEGKATTRISMDVETGAELLVVYEESIVARDERENLESNRTIDVAAMSTTASSESVSRSIAMQPR